MESEVLEAPIVETPEAPMSLRDTLDAAITESETPPEIKEEKAPIAEDKKAVVEETVPLKEDKAAPKVDPLKPQAEEAKLPEAPPIPPKKAPSSWSPAQREKWGKLDPDLQTQILKREREISTGFNEIHEVKKFRDNFLNTINPHQAVFASEGNDPLRTVSNLLQTASTLYHGSAIGKAQTVAAVIKNFGVDLRMLDEILAGQTPSDQGGGGQAFQPQQIQQLIQQGIQQALGPVFQHQQQREQQAEETIVNELTAFAEDSTNEFYEDVKMTMADILDLAANRNEKMSLQTAYSRAILMHSDIADLVQERKLREAAARSNTAAQNARRVSRSISGSPTPSVPGGQAASLRGAIEDAMEQSST